MNLVEYREIEKIFSEVFCAASPSEGPEPFCVVSRGACLLARRKEAQERLTRRLQKTLHALPMSNAPRAMNALVFAFGEEHIEVRVPPWKFDSATSPSMP